MIDKTQRAPNEQLRNARRVTMAYQLAAAELVCRAAAASMSIAQRAACRQVARHDDKILLLAASMLTCCRCLLGLLCGFPSAVAAAAAHETLERARKSRPSCSLGRVALPFGCQASGRVCMKPLARNIAAAGAGIAAPEL